MATETIQTLLNNLTANRIAQLVSVGPLGDLLNALTSSAGKGTNSESPTVTSNVATLANGTVAAGTTPKVTVLTATGAKGVYTKAAGAPSAGQYEVTGSGASITFNSGDAVTVAVIDYIPAGGPLALAQATLQSTAY